jgi:hypothetical protein
MSARRRRRQRPVIARTFRGTIDIDVRASTPDWEPYPGTRPFAFTGGTIKEAIVDVSGEHYVDLELEALALMKRE